MNLYGRSKLIVEEIIKDWVSSDKNNYSMILRYFNPVSAHSSGMIGEEPNGIPNNLMPVIAQVAVGRQEYLKIFGNTYDTIDGTGARDYIHVSELANAHVKALQNQLKLTPFEVLNIGRGKPITVLELIKSFEGILGNNINNKIVPCRKGDISSFWVDSSRAFELIDW